MTKLTAIGLLVVVLVVARAAPATDNGAVTKPGAQEDLGLVYKGDDREPDRKMYEAGLGKQVEAVVSGTEKEESLPTAALPMLADRISDGTLAAATTRPIGDALAADRVRLRNAMAARKLQEWYRKNYWEIFEKNAAGQKWEIPALAVVEAALRSWSGDYMSSADDQVIVFREGKRAEDLGCQEPLFCYVWAQNARDVYGRPTDMDWVAWKGATAAEQMDKDKSGYGPLIQMEAALLAAATAANDKPTADKKKEIDRLIEEAKSRFGEVVADPEIPREEMIGLFGLLEEISVVLNGDRRVLPNSLFDQLKASQVDKSTVLTIRGIFNVNYAWDARGTGWANTVTEEGWRLMRERLAKAANALDEAWHLDPTNSDAADEMLAVELGQGQGRDRMELWFNRAMKANPDDYEACVNKLYYLEPKWYGSADEMLKFGEECVKGGNWDSGIPYIYVKAHLDLAAYTEAVGAQDGEAVYFTSHPEAWDEIRAVHEELMKHRPMSNYKKMEFARIAAWMGHWKEANQMLDEAGGPADFRLWSDDDYAKFVREVRSHK